MLKACFLILAACLLSAGCLQGAQAESNQDAIADAIAQETSKDYVLDTSIPLRFVTSSLRQGTVEEITYTTYDYFGDQAEYTKRAYVYLPYDYSPDRQYKLLILCHGIGGSEDEWGMADRYSKVKMMMDRLIDDGIIEPFIVVTPNGRAGNMSRPGINQSTSYMSFYQFGKELRSDLLPYIEANYSTYAGEENARDHRAMAGLSMGGMQTINIGMCECLDLFSWFGAFSACPTTYTAKEIAQRLEQFPGQEIHYFYNLCGTTDNVAYASASAAAMNILPYTDRLTEANYTWQEKPGGHDFNIWYLGFYNFARIFGAK